MKYASFLFVIVITVFALGCQENNMTGPVVNSSNPLLRPTPNSGLVYLKGDVSRTSVGGTFQQVFHVNGLASYSYVVKGRGINQVYEFTISTQARLVPVDPGVPQGSVNNMWVYQILTVGKQGVVEVQKDYYVPELATKLHVMFALAQDNSFNVEYMWLDQTGMTQVGAN